MTTLCSAYLWTTITTILGTFLLVTNCLRGISRNSICFYNEIVYLLIPRTDECD